MRCYRCGNEVPEDNKFCSNCGNSMEEVKCPECGSKLEGTESFCTKCGCSLSNYQAAKDYFSNGVNELVKGISNSYNNLKNSETLNINTDYNRNSQKKDKWYNENIKLAKEYESKRNKEKVRENVKITDRVTETYTDKKRREQSLKPEGALYFVNGREATISVFPEFIELDFMGNIVKKYLSRLGGVKRVYYHQINSIQKRDASKYLTGSIEFEMPGLVKGRDSKWSNTENVIHYEFYYQEEINALYEYINNKILKIHNPNYVKPVDETENKGNNTLSKIKEAKELLDIDAISQEEFDEIKQKILNEL